MGLISQALKAWKNEGPFGFSRKVLHRLTTGQNPHADKKLKTVFATDVVLADWTHPRKFRIQPPVDGNSRSRIAWVISPPGSSSGGHQNAFRFIKYLEDAGYQITVFLYSASRFPRINVATTLKLVSSSSSYPTLRAEFREYDPLTGISGDFDAIVAADWPTAYASWRYAREVPRFYWVQDYEPFFYAHSTDYVLAENTYRLGMYGIVVGTWLAEKLKREFGMQSDSYSFSVDTELYRRTNDEKRNGVCFYARPNTPRRGTEFGLLVLEEVKKLRPQTEIHIAGSNIPVTHAGFEFKDHGALPLQDLPSLYNQCAAMLSLSLTNPSLVPLENIACGTVAIVNEGDNTRGTFGDQLGIHYADMSVQSMAQTIIRVLDNPQQITHSQRIASSVRGMSWDQEGLKVIDVFDRVLKRKEWN